MKFVLAISLLVLTVDSLNVEAKFYPAKADGRVLDVVDGPLDGDLSSVDENLEMPPANFTRPEGWSHIRVEKEKSESHLRSSKCKPKANCKDQGGSCVKNKEDCRGSILAGGCKGTDCYCCLPGCKEGFFSLPHPANQCLKFYTDVTRNHSQAKEKCAAEGLTLAKPLAPVLLREYMILRYGNWAYAWLQARGDGSNMVWDDGQILWPDNPMWYYPPSGSKLDCLMLLNVNSNWNDYPNKPYTPSFCSSTDTRFALCEDIGE